MCVDFTNTFMDLNMLLVNGLRNSPPLLSLGFLDSKANMSLFFRITHIDIIFLLIYVDDILVLNPQSSSISHFVKSLNSTFSLEGLGHACFFLGIELIPQTDGFLPSQKNYLSNILIKKRTTASLLVLHGLFQTLLPYHMHPPHFQIPLYNEV